MLNLVSIFVCHPFQAERKRRENEALTSIVELSAGETSAKRQFTKLMRACMMVLGCETVSLFLVDKEIGDLVCTETGEKITRGQGVVGHVATTGLFFDTIFPFPHFLGASCG